jgi:predicted dehydrogenase
MKPARSASDMLRVALIGTGWVSTHRHLPSLRATPGVEVVGVVDRNGSRAAEVAKKFGIPRSASVSSMGLEGLAWLGEVDAVVIGTPPRAHHAVASRALSLGKNVLTEKPFALTVAEGEDLSARAEAAGRTLAVVHNFQFSRAFNRLLSDLAKGRLGEPTAIEAHQFSNPNRRLPVWYDDLPGGLFFDESPHLLYLMRRLAGGEMALDDAHAAKNRAGGRTPDLLTAFFRTGSGVPARMTLNFVAPVSEWFVSVAGSKGIGVVDVFRNVYVRLPNDGAHVTSTALRTSALATLRHWAGSARPGIEFLLGRAMYGNREVMRRFAQACRSGAAPEGISKSDGLAVLRLQYTILERVGLA